MEIARWPAVLVVMLLVAGSLRAQSPGPIDTYWTLLHDDAVALDLQFTANQRTKFLALRDELDLQLFPLRNRSAKEAGEGLAKIVADAKSRMPDILKPAQITRLDKLVARQLGMRALLEDNFIKQLSLTEKQRTAISEAIGDSQAALAKVRDAAKGKLPDQLHNEAKAIYQRERDTVVALLTDDQKRKWSGLIAGDFDVSKLGRTRFKVPELIGDASAWRNSPPLSLAAQQGKVVVVHYFACGCINCIHNYPTYREWHKELAGQPVVLIGIHTPETKPEREIAHLESKLKADDLAFPVLIDNEGANWNAWGNSMWPSVYVIDKQGYLRHFWAGELKWEGATGDQIARDWIDRLLAE